MYQENIKFCKRCGTFKNIISFAKNKLTKDGLRVCCKECDKEYRQKISETQKEYLKTYYIENKEKFKEKNKKWIENNREKYNQNKREYLKTKKGKIVNLNRWHKRRAKIKQGKLTSDELSKLIENSKKCYWCGSLLNSKAIHIDHYVPLSKNGTHNIENIVISCSKCNLDKGAKDPYNFAITKQKLC